MEKNIFSENPALIPKSPGRFGEIILSNDVCVSAIILAIGKHGIDLVQDPSQCRQFMPSIMTSEHQSDLIAAGVQAKYSTETYTQWLYTDFFYFNPDGAEVITSDSVLDAVVDIAESERKTYIDGACNAWLRAMRETYGHSIENLYYGDSTGEVSIGTFDIIPGTARKVVLPGEFI